MRQFKGDTNPIFNLGHDMTPDVDSKNKYKANFY
jgi:uroporphyrinogen-III decarboxylase